MSSVPDTLQALRDGTLSGARTLRLNAGLREFPREIFDLADTLEVLDLSGNALTHLPDDVGRLRKLRILFCSGNRFTRLPSSLSDCPALSQVGFRATGLQEIPAESLPPALRWLTVTDNQIATLPDALGERPALQKLMLAGNQLASLPESLQNASRLELLRVSANRFDALPGWITALPALAWLAWAGNPFDHPIHDAASLNVTWSDLAAGGVLGEGASGLVHAAQWRSPDGQTVRPVALKLFKGAMTSDGLPEREMAACLAVGDHPNLLGALGRLTDHPDAVQGLLMPLLPPHWRALAGPPSLESCSRDIYDPSLTLDLDTAMRIAAGIGQATAHLHGRGLTHGDLYAHNVLWDGQAGAAVLSDFGAASFIPDAATAPALQRIDVRAWGILLGELLALTDTVSTAAPRLAALRALQQQCVQPYATQRPLMAEALALLTSLVESTA
jgi:hypothetical protein